MKTLIIDSATKVLYCSLVIDKIVVFEEYIAGQNDHAKKIVQVVEQACNSAGIKVLELDEVVCGIGPGSYTGVRMAVTVAKMICSFSTIELRKISTLFLMASGSGGVVKASIDARRGNAFTGYYKEGVGVREEALLPNTCDYAYDVAVNESSFKVDANLVIMKSTKVENPFLLVPNYLRETEAERNLKND